MDQANFTGQALWLSIDVNGQTLSPRQEILPAPYALSLRPGADIVGESLNAADAALAGYAPATGAALYASAGGGAGLHSQSAQSYGVWEQAPTVGAATSPATTATGLRVHTSGDDHYDHGAYVTSTGGYGVYARADRTRACAARPAMSRDSAAARRRGRGRHRRQSRRPAAVPPVMASTG